MINRVFVDTSAWCAFVDASDPNHAQVKEAIEEADGLTTTNYVFDETVTLIRRRQGHALALKVGTALRDPSEVHTIWIDPALEKDAWALFKARKDKAYSFTDCCSFVAMRRLGITTAVATDADFVREGFEVLP